MKEEHHRPRPPTPSSSSTITRILSGSIGSILYNVSFHPFEVVKVRQQASSASSSSFATTTSTSPFKTFLRGRGAIVLYGIPTNACLIAPQYPVWHPTSQYRAGANASISTTTISRQGVIGNLWTISKYEGRAGLFAGLRPTLLAVVPNATIYLSTYDEITSRLKQYDRSSRSSNSSSSMNNYYYYYQDNSSPRKMHTLRGGSNDTSPWIPFVAGASARLVASVVTGKFVYNYLTLDRSSFSSLTFPIAWFHLELTMSYTSL